MSDATNIELPEEIQRLNRVNLKPQPPLEREGAERATIGELAREAGVTLRALRFYQSKGLLTPARDGRARVYARADRDRLAIILQGKRLGFTLCEIRGMLAARARGCDKSLPINRKTCVEQIKLLERQRRDIELALSELRAIYTGMFKAILSVQRAASDQP